MPGTERKVKVMVMVVHGHMPQSWMQIGVARPTPRSNVNDNSTNMSAAVEEEGAKSRFRLRTESARERDVFRHLHPWVGEYKGSGVEYQPFAVPNTNNDTPSEPNPCPDTALVAFAQLCAVRLRTRRCFVSLISSSKEYVLVEATRTMSLQYDSVEDPRDKAWLGTCNFSRDDGLNALALDGWRKAHHLREPPDDRDFYYTQGMSPHWHIISDVRGNEEYAKLGTVKQHPNLRFYASIPLRGALGSVLGALTIVDDKPRYGLSHTDMAFMEDIADTITEHLYSTAVHAQRRRSERLIQSLGLFNSGKSSLRDWWLQQEESRVSNLGRHKAQNMTSGQRRTAANDEFGNRRSSSEDKGKGIPLPNRPAAVKNRPNENPSSSTRPPNSDDHSAQEQDQATSQPPVQQDSIARTKSIQFQDPESTDTDADRLPLQQSSSQSTRTLADSAYRPTAGEDFDLHTATRRTYARASNLMREALGADGVVFINANGAAPETHNPSSAPNLNRENSNTSGRHSQSDNEGSDGASGAPMCTIHAFSTMKKSSIRGSGQSYSFDISERFLAMLIRKYPQGRVFNFTQDGSASLASGEESMASSSNSDIRVKKVKPRMSKDGSRLGELMEGARMIAFYPVWDETKGSWSTGVFVWSTSPLRFFDAVEDITYLASWSHSVLAELGRLQVIAEDRAKGSFISSVSHELRSPLHGILGGVEFLQESELTPFQAEMSNTISMAGHTLLDTVNHILDYSKISSYTRSKKRPARTSLDSLRKLPSTIGGGGNSDELVHVDLARLTEEIIETVASAYRFQNLNTEEANDLSLALNIPWKSSWVVEIQAGGWTRILNNLVGNSLKYTKKGLVSVRIEVGEFEPGDEGFHSIRLIVQDTGIGIPKPFLLNELYTPFKQSDPHAAGTGLGLSIVRQICEDMDADLNITSELGEGTRATVDLKVRFTANPAKSPAPSSLRLANATSSSSRDLDIDYFCCNTPDMGTFSFPSVEQTICDTAKDWLGCEALPWLAPEVVKGSVVYAIADDDLSRWATEQPEALRQYTANIAKNSSHVLVIARALRSVALSVPMNDIPFTPVFVHQPIGPQKLIRAITSHQSATQMSNMTGERPSSVGSATTPGFKMLGMSSPGPVSPANDYFSGFAPEVRRNRKESLKGKTTTSQELSPNKMPLTSAISTNLHHNTTPSVSRANSSVKVQSLTGNAILTNADGDGNRRRNTVLLVEDNMVNMKLLQALMRKLSLPHLSCANGREAVDTYRADPSSFLLVLMDMSMPVMDGFTATAQIRETERKQHLPRCPIVALTGVTSDDAKRRAYTSGVDEFFSKPVHMKEVRELMERARRNEVGGDR